jgi:ankyrin repeat protein
LDGLTQVLDRRKFCLARESKSGLGLTPLHIAVIYEQLDVFEYLANNFPETLKLTDSNGWTPVDYAKFMPNKTFLDKYLETASHFEV